MEDLMKLILIPVLLSAALITPLAAQTSPAPTPAELREALPRFADAWKHGQFQNLAADLTADFSLLVPTSGLGLFRTPWASRQPPDAASSVPWSWIHSPSSSR
jgi:hypothetical protein